MNVLLTDNYSSYNAGDAAILEGMIMALGEALPGARFTVTSSYPEVATAVHGIPAVLWTPRTLPGRRAVASWFMRSIAWAALMRCHVGAIAQTLVSPDERALLSAYRAADLVVGVGGAYLRSGYRLTNLRLWNLHLAGALGKPVMLYGASVGPFTGRSWWPSHVLNRLDAITLRDRPSLDELHRMGVTRPHIELAADAALSLPVPPPISADEPKPHVGVSVLHWHKFASGSFEAYRDAVAGALDAMLDDWAARVTFMSTTVAPHGSADDVSGTSRDDVSAALDVRSRMVHAERATVWDTPQSVADLRARIGGFDLWIGTRMHSCIFATTSGVPTIAIGYEPKVAGYFDLLGLPDLVLDIESVTADQIALLAGRAWRERDSLRAHLAAQVPEVRDEALVSARVAAELMAGRLDRIQRPEMDRDGPPARGV